MAIHSSAIVDSAAHIDPSVEIGPGVVIEGDVRIDKNVRILANSYICEGTHIAEGTVVHMGAVIGNVPQDYAFKGGKSFTKIGKNNIIREYVTIHRGTEEGTSTVIGDNNMLMVQVHVGHNVTIEDKVIVANSTILAGHMFVGREAFVSGNVVFHQYCRIGRNAMIGGFTGVNKDVPPYLLVRGPSAVRGVNLVGLRRAGFSREVIKEIKEAYRILYRSDIETQAKALEKIKSTLKSDEIKHFIGFIEGSTRGICKGQYNKDIYFEQ